uniref:Uncharacterized protein n=1 Tax=Anguilla anguilla TaxID=7936 RepID=A0A0E9RE89_ANGAN
MGWKNNLRSLSQVPKVLQTLPRTLPQNYLMKNTEESTLDILSSLRAILLHLKVKTGTMNKLPVPRGLVPWLLRSSG